MSGISATYVCKEMTNIRRELDPLVSMGFEESTSRKLTYLCARLNHVSRGGDYRCRTVGRSEKNPLVGLDVTDPNVAHDHVLTVGTKKFYVQKAMLSIYSSYFNRMFNGNFDEAKTDETNLEEVDSKQFENLLRLLYPGNYLITDNNAIFLWKLADRFDIPSIVNICEQHLCNMDDYEKSLIKISDRLELAERFGSSKLKDAAFDFLISKGM